MLLLDEIEKAHPDVFNTLLQVLDDGRLTDGQGRTVDFKNTVVIMTSNLGSQWILAADDAATMEEKVMATVRDSFKPEFLNRLDEIIVFHRLSRDHLARIVDVQTEIVRRRLGERGIDLVLTDEARDYLADKGYDPAYGARPLKRLIQREIENDVAMKLLDGTVRAGDTVEVAAGPDRLTFESVREPVGRAAS